MFGGRKAAEDRTARGRPPSIFAAVVAPSGTRQRTLKALSSEAAATTPPF